MPLLQFTDRGIHCAQADVYIDPWKRVDKALITHGHSDHARSGMARYYCTELTKSILLHRLGHNIHATSVAYGETIHVNGVKFSFHPAGHVIGSAQVRVEYKGEVWVVSGDYKTQSDGISGDFEPVRCNAFITESTYGIPVYRWPAQNEVFEEINQWWASNREAGKASIITAYSLGKAQRVLQNVDDSIGPIFCHGAVDQTNKVFRSTGVPLRKARHVDNKVSWEDLKGALVITPGSALSTPWIKRFKDYSTAGASGWMAIRGTRRWQSVDRGFVLSDHADWKGLNSAIAATGAEHVIVTHGYADVFARWLRDQGYDAITEKTQYESID